jgi:hypothetical protein
LNKIIRKPYSAKYFRQQCFCEKCLKQKMLDTEIFSMTVKNEIFSMLPLAGGAGGGSPLNFDINPLAGVQGAAAP